MTLSHGSTDAVGAHDPIRLQRRIGARSVYLRPEEAQAAYKAIWALMATDEEDEQNPHLARVLDKLWAIDWEGDLAPREGVDG